MFQHTAARRRLQKVQSVKALLSCFNTQPRGGGCFVHLENNNYLLVFQHTAARRRLPYIPKEIQSYTLEGFQHTAARRRLLTYSPCLIRGVIVSTHSRAEAAAFSGSGSASCFGCFNTQPRGGGCVASGGSKTLQKGFNTQPRGGGCSIHPNPEKSSTLFQHTAARRRLRG